MTYISQFRAGQLPITFSKSFPSGQWYFFPEVDFPYHLGVFKMLWPNELSVCVTQPCFIVLLERTRSLRRDYKSSVQFIASVAISDCSAMNQSKPLSLRFGHFRNSRLSPTEFSRKRCIGRNPEDFNFFQLTVKVSLRSTRLRQWDLKYECHQSVDLRHSQKLLLDASLRFSTQFFRLRLDPFSS
jgi:hypothetical protein